jgi:hypothetical protein
VSQIRLAFSLAVLPLLFGLSLSGDTIELKTGERIEGAFKQANSAGAVIEVAGQPITIPLEKIQAIYFGAVPSRTVAGPAPSQEALDALKALRSVVQTGLDYREYSQRVLDAKVKVDQYLSAPANGAAERNGIETAMREYELARDAWDASFNFLNTLKLSGERRQAIGQFLEDPETTCPVLTDFVGQEGRGRHGESLASLFLTQAAALYQARHTRVYESLWTCASAQVAQAERLITQH